MIIDSVGNQRKPGCIGISDLAAAEPWRAPHECINNPREDSLKCDQAAVADSGSDGKLDMTRLSTAGGL